MAAGVKWVFSGSGLGETFQYGFYTGTGGVSSQDDMQAAADDVASKINALPAWWTAFVAHLSSDQTYTKVTGYYYADLAASATAVGEGVIASGKGTGTSTVHNPLQTSLVISTLTGAPGASRRGRIYLPATGKAPSVGHQFTSSDVDLMIKGVAGDGSPTSPDSLMSITCFALDAQGSGGAVPILYSRKNDATYPLTAVRGDSIPDVQRRRAESLVPLYSNTHGIVLPA